MSTMSDGLPRVLTQKVLAIRGKWVVYGRIVLYHRGQVRRAEVVFEPDPLSKNLAEVGFSLEELGQLQGLLHKFAVESGELA